MAPLFTSSPHQLRRQRHGNVRPSAWPCCTEIGRTVTISFRHRRSHAPCGSKREKYFPQLIQAHSRTIWISFVTTQDWNVKPDQPTSFTYDRKIRRFDCLRGLRLSDFHPQQFLALFLSFLIRFPSQFFLLFRLLFRITGLFIGFFMLSVFF